MRVVMGTHRAPEQQEFSFSSKSIEKSCEGKILCLDEFREKIHIERLKKEFYYKLPENVAHLYEVKEM
jgi:hypothetical protein